MRLKTIVLGLLAAGWLGAGIATGAESKPAAGLIARVHFAGFNAVLADTNNATLLNEIAALPSTTELENSLARKLSVVPFNFLKSRAPANATDQSLRLRTLADDLIHLESYAELWEPKGGVPGLALAVRVGAARSAFWSTNLAAVIESWTGMKVVTFSGSGYGGWELKKHHNPNVIRSVTAGDWAVFGWGQDGVTGLAEILERIKKQGNPATPLKDAWLEAWADLPALATFQTNQIPFELPQLTVNFSTRSNFIRTKADLQFREPLNLSLTPWNIPTNLVRNPLIYFTAARGVSSWLEKSETVRGMNLKPTPNELFHWGSTKLVFESFLAAPYPNATNALREFAPGIIAQANRHLAVRGVGNWRWNSTNRVIEWTSMPTMIAPHLGATSGTNGSYLVAGLWQPLRGLAQAPPELFNQVYAKPNLVYYDWEVTGEHLSYWRNLYLLYTTSTGRFYGPADVSIQSWLESLAEKLSAAGPTVTEVTLAAPNQLSLVRKSTLGFTALEWTALERWIGSPGFPLSYEYTPRFKLKPSKVTETSGK